MQDFHASGSGGAGPAYRGREVNHVDYLVFPEGDTVAIGEFKLEWQE
jgi:hypothetical protein